MESTPEALCTVTAAITKYHHTELYTALKLDMLSTHAAYVMYGLGWPVGERSNRRSTPRAEQSLAMLFRMTAEQRDQWAVAKIRQAEARKLAEIATNEVASLEDWANKTAGERAEAEAASHERFADFENDYQEDEPYDDATKSDDDMEAEGFVWNENKGHFQ